jgi:hypothetical protein
VAVASNLRLIGVETKYYIDIDEMIEELIKPLLKADVPLIDINGEMLDGVDFVREAVYDAIEAQLEG